MSDESISRREDRENLLYIFKKIKKFEQYQLVGDDVDATKSYSISEEEPAFAFQSDLSLYSEINKHVGHEVLKNPQMIAKTKPFDFIWTYAVESKIALINLATEDRKEVLFVASQLPILYNFTTKEMRCLEGHQHHISSISTDGSRRWIASADNHKDGYVIIWDKEELKPVHTLFGLYSTSGTLLTQLSWRAKYLITLGVKNEGFYSVDLWEWTYGNEEPNGSCQVKSEYGAPVGIYFSPNREEFLMVIFKKKVIFFVWDAEQSKLTKSKIPHVPPKSAVGSLTTGTYLPNCHDCYVGSTKGFVVVFGTTIYDKPFEDGELSNSKNFRGAVKVSDHAISSCVAIAGSIAISDVRGSILFFDRNINILYWLRNFKIGSITCLSFSLTPKILSEDESKIHIDTTKPSSVQTFESAFSDITGELKKCFKNNLPTGVGLQKFPFLAYDLFVGTVDGGIYAIDLLTNKCVPFDMMRSQVSVIEIHDELPYMVIGFDNGRMELMNYETNELVCSTSLPPYSNECTSISSLKYSPGSLHLVCGRENGEIWILEPIVLTPKVDVPIRATIHRVQKVIFSDKIVQFAYFDDHMVVVLCQYDTYEYKWKFAGKVKSHYEPINDMIFMTIDKKPVLYTIASDRHLVGYTNLTLDEHGFDIETRDRIEQRAIPMSMIQWADERGGELCYFFLIADNEHKFKLLEASSKVPIAIVLAPAYGCFKNQLITKMMMIPKTESSESKYMVFMSNKYVGLHIVPPDGNPYKYVGYLAHPSKITDFCLSPDGKYVFTFAVEENCIFKWEIKTKAVELMNVIGGKELEPFYCLIEGGKNGWLFQEIKDLFYYMQILDHDDSSPDSRRVSDNISIRNLPDLIRTCGYYPSEFELENLIIDIQCRNYFETGFANTEINFIDFVKLFCNHKPVYGYFKENIKNAFETIVEYSGSRTIDKINRDKFCSILSYSGENINLRALLKIMKTLMRSDDSGGTLDFLPQEITFKILTDEIFGIDMGKAKTITTKVENE